MSKYLIDIFESELFSTPWPTFIDRHFIDGSKITINPVCKSCINKECIDSTSFKNVCYKNLVSYSKTSGNTKITVFGFEEQQRLKKQTFKTLPLESYNKWIENILLLNEKIDAESLKKTSEILHLFHDPVKLADQIKISSEKMIENKVGDSFKDKLNNSSNELKSIYQSSKLLTDSIKMLEIYFNPESASYGQTIRTNIYKLFDKVQAIIYFSEDKSRNKKFNLKGKSHREIFLYESFPIIPLSLIHNALKYSKSREIDINIEDTAHGVEVHVSSVGPQITDQEIDKIFDKGFRGKYAKKLHHDGMGIGLYVATCVAIRHNFSINVKSKPLNYANDNMQMAENIFSFEVNSSGV